MIYAKTKLRKVPKSCDNCLFAHKDCFGYKGCVITGRDCPWEDGHYNILSWCQLESTKINKIQSDEHELISTVGKCKDCKYQGGNIIGNPNVLCINMKPDDFCSYFEPKDY